MNEGYTFGAATLEIIILVIAAFLLGMLLCWLLRKLGLCCAGRTHDDAQQHDYDDPRASDVDALRASMRGGSSSSNAVNTNSQPQRVSAPPQSTDDSDSTTAASGIAAAAATATGAAAVKLTGDTATYTAKNPAGEDGETTRTITGDKVAEAAESTGDATEDTVNKAQGLMADVKDQAEDAVDAAKENASDATDTAKGLVGAAVAGATAKAAAADTKPDDLKKLEGIGPKIEQLLHAAGIKTFEQLATQERDALKAILEAGGNRFKMHEPKSWPYQAELAAKGDWDRLKEYQDFLIGGREK